MTDAQHEETARRPTGWPSDKPVWTITVFLLAALVVPGRIAFEYARHWNELGTFYLPHYIASGVPWSAGARRCRLLETVTRRGVHLTASREVEPVLQRAERQRPQPERAADHAVLLRLEDDLRAVR